MRILKSDVMAGLMFTAVGLIAVIGVSGNSFGSARNIGPGFFPTIVGWSLIGMGLIIGMRGLLAVADEQLPQFKLRPFFVVVGVLAFAVLLPLAGIYVATAAMLIFAGLASKDSRPLEVVILFFVLTTILVVGLIWGLGLQFPLWID